MMMDRVSWSGRSLLLRAATAAVAPEYSVICL